MKNRKTKKNVLRFQHEDGIRLKSPLRDDPAAMLPATAAAASEGAGESFFFVYPFDFWEILGSYVRPEEVATFARLCHATYAVVNRPNFWLALYRFGWFCLLLTKEYFPSSHSSNNLGYLF